MTERDCCQPLQDGGVLGIGAAVIASRAAVIAARNSPSSTAV